MQEEKESKIELKVGQYSFVGTDPLFEQGWITKVTSLKDPTPTSKGYRCRGILLYYRAKSKGGQFYEKPTSIQYQLDGRRYLRAATDIEIRWLEACIKQNKAVPKPLGYLRTFLNHKNWI